MSPSSDSVSHLQHLLHRVFTESCHLETAHSELLANTPKDFRPSLYPLFQTSKLLLTHWRLLCYLADQEFRLDASLAGKLHPILEAFRDENRVDFSNTTGRTLKWESVLQNARKQPAIYYSLPDDLFGKLHASLENDTNTTLARFNQSTDPDLRVNPLRTDLRTLGKALVKDGFSVKQIGDDCLQVSGNRNLYGTESYQAGWFEIQDRSSQQVAPFTGAKPGDRVLDACAGAGGKSLHLAALMQNRGRLIAMDIFQHKLDQLTLRARRAGVHCIETRLKTSTKTVKRLNDKMDVVLLDVPCTGSGTLRQHPEIKWSYSEERLQNILQEQATLFNRHATVVKPGGTLVYATCSLLKQENDYQIDTFLSTHSNFVEEERRTVLPGTDGGHGFFMSRLRRNLHRNP